MAYNNTIINYYNTVIANSYESNISGQITRIEDAHKAIRSKAIELGLSIPAKAKLTSNLNGTTDLLLSDVHHILDTAAAINNIPINEHVDKTIDAGEQYVVPVGYNAKTYTIKSSGLSGQTPGTATSFDILVGKTAWVDGQQITGTLPDKSGDQSISSFNYYTEGGKNYLYFSVPGTGKYVDGAKLKSSILYNSGSTVEIPVTVNTTSTGETILDVSQKSFPAGYYSSDINIKAVYKAGETNKVINIDNAVGQLTAQSGKLSITSGYDYFASDATYSIKEGSITDVKRNVNSDTGSITFEGGVVTEGWISNNVVLPTTYTPPTATFDINTTTGKLTVSAAGWITKGTELGGLSAGSAIMTGPVRNTGSAAITVGSVSIAKNNYYIQLNKTAGYITSGTEGIDLGNTTLAYNTLTSAGSNAKSVENKYFSITALKGYNDSNLVQNLTIANATYTKNSTSGVITVSKGGWIDAGSYGGLNQGSVTLSNVQTQGGSASTINGVSIPAGKHYVKVDVTAGYVTGNESTALNLGKVIVNDGTSSGTKTNDITSKKWNVNISQGYNASEINKVFEVKSGSINNSVTISGDDYNCTLNVTEGWVDTQTVELNINAKDQSYVLQPDDLNDEDHVLQINAAEGTLMKSLTIDNTIIYNRLSQI